MSFHLYTSNHLTILAHLLKTKLLSENGKNVMPEEMIRKRKIVVQTPGMGTWLKLYLADKCGIMANIDFPFLQAFIQETMQKHSDIKAHNITPSNELVWKIYHHLEEKIHLYPELSDYFLSQDIDLKRWQIANEIAYLFDQYQAFIPQEMILWQNKEEQNCEKSWQERLYCALFDNEFTREKSLEIFRKDPQFPSDECPVITLFGVSAMPPLHLDFFKALSKICQVDLYYLNPSDTHWCQRQSKNQTFKEQMELLFSGQKKEKHSPILNSISNPILDQCGEVGRQFLRQIKSDEFQFTTDNDYFLEGCYHSVLSTLQSDILMNTTPSEKSLLSDNSILVHNCHSPLREIEVLHDQILHIIKDSNGDIQPRDILVMAPNIQLYEPFIEAVFGDGPLKYLYSITDRQFKSSSHICELFLSIIHMARTRFTYSEVMTLFQSESIRLQFNVSQSEYERLARWIKNSGIRWGEDEKMHEKFSGYAFSEYSWKQGFERLFMGISLHPDYFDAYQPMYAPLDEIEGDNVEILGAFKSFTDLLFSLTSKLNQTQLVSEWKTLLSSILSTFFVRNDQTREECLLIEQAIENIPKSISSLQIPYSVMDAYLNSAMETTFSSGGFLRGSITFCAMIPMRSIPRKLICILGLNDGQFPRMDRKNSFNLLLSENKFSSKVFYKSRQLEDRYLFLEAILSAEEKLLLFYCGQDPKSSDTFPPAIPLGELIDYLHARFDFKETKHRLQSFSAQYFLTNSHLTTYNLPAYKVASQLQDMIKTKKELYLPDVKEFIFSGSLELDEFEKALHHPIEYHLYYYTSIRFSSFQEKAINDDERFGIDYLDRYHLFQTIAERSFIKKQSISEQLNIYKRMNLLPISIDSSLELGNIFQGINAINFVWKKAYTSLQKRAFSFKLGNIYLSGTVELDENSQSQYYTRFSKLKSKDIINVWIRHLIINYLWGEKSSYILEMNTKIFEYTLLPLSKQESKLHLEELLFTYNQSLIFLIPFFPVSSFAFALNENKKKEIRYEEFIKKAQGGYYFKSELENDLALNKCYKLENLPQEEDVEKYAKILLRPFYTFENEKLLIVESYEVTI